MPKGHYNNYSSQSSSSWDWMQWWEGSSRKPSTQVRGNSGRKNSSNSHWSTPAPSGPIEANGKMLKETPDRIKREAAKSVLVESDRQLPCILLPLSFTLSISLKSQLLHETVYATGKSFAVCTSSNKDELNLEHIAFKRTK